MEQAFAFTWTESERGWGTRPDGFSVHVSAEEALQYVERHWASFPSGRAPDEYDRPDSEKPFGVVLQDAAFARLLKEKKSVRLWQNQATIETQTDGRRFLVIRDTKLLLQAPGQPVASTPSQPIDKAEHPVLANVSAAKAQNADTEKTPTFVDLCLAKLAKPTDFKSFLDQWHQGGGREYPNVWEFMGLARDEFDTVLADASKVYEVVFRYVQARHAKPWYARPKNSAEPCMVPFVGLYEATLTPMVAFQQLSGQIRFLEEDAFNDQFERVSVEESAACHTLFKRVLADNPGTFCAMHVKSDGAYLVYFAGAHAATGKLLTAYQGLDGKVWFRDSDVFNDGRFMRLP